LQKRANRVWRRRQCLHCQAVFTTEEAVQYGGAWAVEGPKGRPKPFSRDKLLLSLYNSLGHRKTALADAGHLADTVIKKLAGQFEGGALTAATIRRTAQVALALCDKAAGVHYEAHHPA